MLSIEATRLSTVDGIQDRNGKPLREGAERKGKTVVRTRLADGNTIRNNKIAGPRDAWLNSIGVKAFGASANVGTGI